MINAANVLPLLPQVHKGHLRGVILHLPSYQPVLAPPKFLLGGRMQLCELPAGGVPPTQLVCKAKSGSADSEHACLARPSRA